MGETRRNVKYRSVKRCAVSHERNCKKSNSLSLNKTFRCKHNYNLNFHVCPIKKIENFPVISFLFVGCCMVHWLPDHFHYLLAAKNAVISIANILFFYLVSL